MITRLRREDVCFLHVAIREFRDIFVCCDDEISSFDMLSGVIPL